jgi:hypothetical protein
MVSFISINFIKIHQHQFHDNPSSDFRVVMWQQTNSGSLILEFLEPHIANALKRGP